MSLFDRSSSSQKSGSRYSIESRRLCRPLELQGVCDGTQTPIRLVLIRAGATQADVVTSDVVQEGSEMVLRIGFRARTITLQARVLRARAATTPTGTFLRAEVTLRLHPATPLDAREWVGLLERVTVPV